MKDFHFLLMLMQWGFLVIGFIFFLLGWLKRQSKLCFWSSETVLFVAILLTVEMLLFGDNTLIWVLFVLLLSYGVFRESSRLEKKDNKEGG